MTSRRILECLGAAVVSVWAACGEHSSAIFAYTAAPQALDTMTLSKQIAQFLYDHH